MAIRLAVTNQKGGVGKTTTACALAGVLTLRGKRVLAVDLDPQGNLSFSLGAKNLGETIHEVLLGSLAITAVIQQTPNDCDVLPSNILLSGMELELNKPGREFALKEVLGAVDGFYDYIILDTPPALSVLTINAYAAAHELIIPMTPEVLSLQGINQLKDTIVGVKKYYNKELAVRGILFTKYAPRVLLTQEVEEMVGIVARQLDTTILNTKISPAVQVAEAPAHQQTLVRYDPHCKASKEYVALVKELYHI